MQLSRYFCKILANSSMCIYLSYFCLFHLLQFVFFSLQLSDENVSLASVDIEDTLQLHLNISDLSNRDHILEFTPALSTLSDHVRYSIDYGNDEGYFKINQKQGVSYLHLSKKKALPPGAYYLQISSMPLYRKKELTEMEDQHDKDYLTGQLGDILKMRVQIILH